MSNKKFVNFYTKVSVMAMAVLYDGSTDCLLALNEDPFGLDPVRVNPDNTLNIETLEGTMKANVGDYIIKGVNGEFYPCKPDVFAKTYQSVNECGMSFGQAIAALKQGKRVARKGWNGKGMFLTLQDGSDVSGTLMRNENARDFYKDGTVHICPHIDMKAADGSYVVGWSASQTDMLSDDWQVILHV